MEEEKYYIKMVIFMTDNFLKECDKAMGKNI